MSGGEWSIFYFKLYAETIRQLTQDVLELSKKDPSGFSDHNKTKLLHKLYKMTFEDIPADPAHDKYRCTGSLGSHKSWRRAKHKRYRLFFKFSSDKKSIAYVWFNDSTSIRRSGDKADVYNVFLKMLQNNKVPSSFADILKESVAT
jgi:toxin YhaV